MSDQSISSRVTILDGGLGTTLEENGYDVSSRLWSGDPKLFDGVKKVHRGFLESGAGMVGTATYQSTLSLYTEAGITQDDQSAGQLMRQAVHNSFDAVTQSSGSTSSTNEIEARGGEVGLCLGPFGATLVPGQEYSGIYPPPYGPRAFDKSNSDTNQFGSQSPSFLPNGPLPALEEVAAVQALGKFHLDRLLVYASDPLTWSRICWICFETIPLLREIVAIRLALGQLRVRLQEIYGGGSAVETYEKPVWISCVFPGGKFPDGSSAEWVVKHILNPDLISGIDAGGQATTATVPLPNAIGINCTSPAYIPSLVETYTQTLNALQVQEKISLVFYPDGGLVYDPITRTWHAPSDLPAGSDGSAASNSSWAEKISQVAVKAAGAKSTSGDVFTWNHIFVGGCCKAGFDEIKGLRGCLRS